MNKFVALAMAGVSAIGCAGSANAVILSATSVTAAYSSAPTADLHKTSSPTASDGNVSVVPQIIKGTQNGAAVQYFAYCVDIFQYSGATNFNLVSLDDYVTDYLHKTDPAANMLVDRLSALIFDENLNGSSHDKAHDAAVQLAVWELINETQTDLDINKVTQTSVVQDGWTYDRHTGWTPKYKTITTTPPQFWADDVHNGRSGGQSILDDANSFLDEAVADSGNDFSGLSLYVAQSSSKQDFLVWTFTPPPVPEPATWAMMLLGLGAVGYTMRRRRAVSVSFS